MRICLQVMLVLLVAVSAVPRQPESHSAPMFSVGIRAEPEVVKPGSAVTVRSVVTNTSDQKIWVVSLGEEVSFHVWDTHGLPLRRITPHSDCAKLYQDKHGQYSVAQPVMVRGVWFPVLPGRTVEHEFVISDFYDLSRPGTYTIQAVRPDPESHAAVKSNKVTVRVAP